MTAEIAVYNKSAVALAADSAVTISGGGKQKIYNGAEKLFALTKHHPVGLMVYGSGDLCSAPWELVIKAYRKKLGVKSFSTLEEYADDFFSFLQGSLNIVTPGMRSGHLYQYLAEGVFTPLVETFAQNKTDDFWSNFNQDAFLSQFEEHCQEVLEFLSDTDFLSGFSGDDMDDALEYCDSVTIRIVTDKFNFGDIPEALIRVVKHIFAAMICKKSDTGNISGIVIAGYGEDEFYPQVLSYNVCGFFNNKLRKSLNTEKCSEFGQSGVTPFAQDDEVSAFMQGVSDNLLVNLHTAYQSSLASMIDEVEKSILQYVPEESSEAVQQAILGVAQNTFANCKAHVDTFVHENYISKVVNMIKFLPKQDLAYMAESLVNLTAFKRKVSDDSETVGGPIDVAIISKADGFIWVKRKHYFIKDLNHHYFDRS